MRIHKYLEDRIDPINLVSDQAVESKIVGGAYIQKYLTIGLAFIEL